MVCAGEPKKLRLCFAIRPVPRLSQGKDGSLNELDLQNLTRPRAARARDFDSVVEYLHQPAALLAEMGLVVSVIVHASVAVRSFLVELIHDRRVLRYLDYVIAAVAIGTFGYTVWITATIVSLSVD